MTKWRFARPGSTKWALVSMAREVPPRHLLVSSLAIAAYVALALIVFFWGDIRTSCRDASEIAVDGTGQIHCSLPTQASINVFSAQGELVRQLSLETLGGWVSLHEAPDGRVGAYLVRAHRGILFAPDGAVVEAPGDAGSLPRPRHFPITRVEKGESVYVLDNGEVYRTQGEDRALLIASWTPWIVPAIPWVLIAPAMTAVGLLFAWAARRRVLPRTSL